MRQQVGQNRPKLAQIGDQSPKSVQVWRATDSAGKFGPSLAEFGPSLVKIIPYVAESGSKLVKLGPNLAVIRPNLVKCGAKPRPKSVDHHRACGRMADQRDIPRSTEIDQVRPSLSTDFHLFGPKVSQSTGCLLGGNSREGGAPMAGRGGNFRPACPPAPARPPLSARPRAAGPHARPPVRSCAPPRPLVRPPTRPPARQS